MESCHSEVSCISELYKELETCWVCSEQKLNLLKIHKFIMFFNVIIDFYSFESDDIIIKAFH